MGLFKKSVMRENNFFRGNKMKKTVILLSFCLIIALFAACGQTGAASDLESGKQKSAAEKQVYPVDLVTEKWNDFVEFTDGDMSISHVELSGEDIIKITFLVDLLTIKDSTFTDDIVKGCYVLDENSQKISMSGDINRLINGTNIQTTIEFQVADGFDMTKAAFVYEDKYWGLAE